MAAAFPASITYILNEDRKNTLPQKMIGLGGKTILLERPKISIRVQLISDTDREAFRSWWIDDLDYGTAEFTIPVPFFGSTDTWTVRASGEISETPDAGASTIDMTLIVLDTALTDVIDGVVMYSDSVVMYGDSVGIHTTE